MLHILTGADRSLLLFDLQKRGNSLRFHLFVLLQAFTTFLPFNSFHALTGFTSATTTTTTTAAQLNSTTTTYIFSSIAILHHHTFLGSPLFILLSA
ncbi:hypothetical protein L6452_32315 [Arctium lappa]|uniref:Uncharacterized protein n=1 Tax=Arctium lappa TaxID=4217 RepID=A0ACB8Z5H8_ARCLA|nr:hypothetical protein L6452_32315 [Arctium lappa]